MYFVLLDEEKHKREQNHILNMNFFSQTLICMANSHYQSGLAFVHRQDVFTGQNLSLWENICLTHKPTVSLRRTKPKPLIFLLTNKHVLSYNLPFHQDFPQQKDLSLKLLYPRGFQGHS